ncbi:unnamed protein product [Closterium sp. NIES-53]
MRNLFRSILTLLYSLPHATPNPGSRAVSLPIQPPSRHPIPPARAPHLSAPLSIVSRFSPSPFPHSPPLLPRFPHQQLHPPACYPPTTSFPPPSSPPSPLHGFCSFLSASSILPCICYFCEVGSRLGNHTRHPLFQPVAVSNRFFHQNELII